MAAGTELLVCGMILVEVGLAAECALPVLLVVSAASVDLAAKN
jgi:hypothetical protein